MVCEVSVRIGRPNGKWSEVYFTNTGCEGPLHVSAGCGGEKSVRGLQINHAGRKLILDKTVEDPGERDENLRADSHRRADSAAGRLRHHHQQPGDYFPCPA